MNIAMVHSTPFPPKEGIGYYVYKLSQRLRERGHHVTVITRGSISTTNQDYFEGIDVLRLPFAPVYPFHVDLHGVFVNRLLERLQDDFDLVHVHSPLTPKIDTSVPSVLTVHTSAVEDAKQLQNLSLSVVLNKLLASVTSKRIIASQITDANRVTAVSNSTQRELQDHFGYDDALVVGNGVDTTDFCPDAPRNCEPFILYVGRLAEGKGLSDLLESIEQLSAAPCRTPTLKITGEGPLKSSLEKQARRAGIEPNVQFLGFIERDELRHLYRKAMLFVLPSYHEGLPTVLLEAMACETPVITTDIDSCAEVVRHEENGLLVPTGQPSKLATAIRRLLNDDALRAKIGRNARETVEETYSIETVVDKFERVYDKISEKP